MDSVALIDACLFLHVNTRTHTGHQPLKCTFSTHHLRLLSAQSRVRYNPSSHTILNTFFPTFHSNLVRLNRPHRRKFAPQHHPRRTAHLTSAAAPKPLKPYPAHPNSLRPRSSSHPSPPLPRQLLRALAPSSRPPRAYQTLARSRAPPSPPRARA